MKTKEQIALETDIVRRASKYRYEEGTGGQKTGILIWVSVLIVLFIGTGIITALVVGIVLGSILGILDTKTVDRNEMTSIVNRYTKKPVANWGPGRHWAGFWSLLYKVTETYKTTQHSLVVSLRDVACDRDDEQGPSDAPISMDAEIETSFVIADALAFEDMGGEMALRQIATEIRDVATAYVRTRALSTLEAEKNIELDEYFQDEAPEIVELVRRSGLVWLKVDMYNARPSKTYAQSRQSKAIAIQQSEGKKEESNARRKRIEDAYYDFLNRGFSRKEAMLHAEARIDKQDGFQTKVVYEGLNGGNTQGVIPLKK